MEPGSTAAVSSAPIIVQVHPKSPAHRQDNDDGEGERRRVPADDDGAAVPAVTGDFAAVRSRRGGRRTAV